MNKQEAIEQLEWNVMRTSDFDRAEDVVVFEKVKSIISQIHEPQKVVVPKHIADKIEYCKNTEGYGLFHAMDHCFGYSDSAEWLEYNQETFALAWVYGYEIEKEVLYFVEIPNPNSRDVYDYFLKKDSSTGKVVLFKRSVNPRNNKDLWLTESEIKQDFEWAWDAGFAKEVE
ncbi:DUF1642 domain-containing protein [Streptococcus sp. 11273D007BW]|nr:DUF1642 domain-containing protein [Streptococcus sp.]